MKKAFFALVFALAQVLVLAQGQFLLIGGGGEEYGDWSDAPYKWAVDQAAPNKRVAVLTFSTSTNWIPDYFKSLGATEAKIFKITTLAQANDQSLYDSLMTYSIVFIKGGDQSNYYKNWKQTKLAEALFDIYQKGGTLAGTSAGMAILAPVSYVALGASIYPDESIKNPLDANITLADDFFAAAKNPWPTAWGRFIFETHTAERGRFARLPAFLANWFLKKGETVRGLAVDDHTTLAIEKTGKATVMGSGSMTFQWFDGGSPQPFSNAATMLEYSDLRTTRLVDGMHFEFPKPKSADAAQLDFPPVGNPNVSKSEVFGQNVAFLTSDEDATSIAVLADALAGEAAATDRFVILDFGGAADPTALQADLSANGFANVDYYLIDAAAGGIVSLHDALVSNEKIWWVLIGKDFANASDFWYGTPNGQLLQAISNQNGAAKKGRFVFVGPASEWAGRSVCNECHAVGLGAFDGSLTFSRGLEVVNSAVVMADAWDFSASTFYENTANAVPFAMLRDTADTGIWLNGNVIARYEKDQCAHKLKHISGDYPIVFFDRGLDRYDFVSALLLNHTSPRQIGSFWAINMSNIGPSLEHEYNGCLLSTNTILDEWAVKISPNPTSDFLEVFCQNFDRAQLIDYSGKILSEHHTKTISVKGIPSGNYFLKVFEKGTNSFRSISFFKN